MPETAQSPNGLFKESGLTQSQLSIWIGQSLVPDNPLYSLPFILSLETSIDWERFKNAWQGCVDASDSIRTSVIEKKGQPIINILPEGSCSLKFLDLSQSDNDGFCAWSKARSSVALPLDGELMDSVLVKLGEEKFGWYLNQHHLVTDASSTVFLVNQVLEQYNNQSKDDKIGQPMSYYELYNELDKRLEPRKEDARNYWKKNQPNRTTPIPIYGKRHPADSTKSERIGFTLGKAKSEKLRVISGESNFQSFFPDISLFAVFSALFTVLLKRVSGESDISFDAPFQCRPTPESKDCTGCFIELFPLSVSLENADTFSYLGDKCMAEVQGLLANALPGTRSPPKDQANNAVLNFFPGSFAQFEDLEFESKWLHSGHMDSVHDIRLQIHDYDDVGRYTFQFDLNCEMFPSEKRTEIIESFKLIINAFFSSRDTIIDQIDVLPEKERQNLLVDYNNTSNCPIPKGTIVDRFLEQVKKTPDRVAVRETRYSLTFEELSHKVDLFAWKMQNECGENPVAIGVCMKRSIDAVVSILAILRSGNHYIPIDPIYPKERIQRILDDSNATLLITHRDLNHSLQVCDTAIWNYDDIEFTESVNTTGLPLPESKDLSYIIYTSGSTGKPKGVEIEHRGLIDYIDWAARQYVDDKIYSFPLFTSLSFDLTVTSLYLPLITGGTLVIYEETEGPVDSSLISVINDNAIHFVKLTPSHLSLLRQMDLSNSRIEKMVLGGEDLKCELARHVSEQFQGKIDIFNEYGPTEAVVGCMIHKFDPDTDPNNGTSVPIGVPADHVKLYVLNDLQNPVPAGVPGELYITRNGLARGYHNSPEKTAQVFLENPFCQNERFYRTGDLVRFNDDGVLVYLGRTDEQLKISGHRIEPGEIEHALNSHPSISSSLVTAFDQRGSFNASAKTTHCTQCGLPSNYPNILFDEQGVCNVCQTFESIKDKAKAYFKSKESLLEIFDSVRAKSKTLLKYDCMMFYSGGKDSSFALCKLVDLGLKVYAFTLDNGYISDGAKTNISKVVESLGIDHEFASTPYMNRIFKDSLTRFSNVCNGCFKTIYTLGINRAHELGIPIIVTGLSRGQFFETRLTENLFKNGHFSPDQVDEAVLEARKAYHKTDDEVSRCLDVSLVQRDETFNEIQFVDFYRYWDVSLTELYAYLEERVPWIRPKDTGRSTNCVVNDVGIYIHNKERGYHNYALPYSWDVRMGHKERDEALDELDDKFELSDVKRMLSEIEYDEDRLTRISGRSQLVGYYVSKEPIEYSTLKRHLSKTLPEQMIPPILIHLIEIPLTVNGKVNTKLLPKPNEENQEESETFVQASGPVEEHVTKIWSSFFPNNKIGANDDFFKLGGTSLSAMEVSLQICNDFEIDLPLQMIFRHSTISSISTQIEEIIMREIDDLTDDEAEIELQS